MAAATSRGTVSQAFAVSRNVGPEMLIDAMMSPWALRIGAAAAVRPDLELVDREGVARPRGPSPGSSAAGAAS